MEKEKSIIDSLTEEIVYKIFTDDVCYFIPGQREDNEYFGFFDGLATNYFAFFDTSLGAGWLFDKEGIGLIIKDFEREGVNYVEIHIDGIRMHRNVR